MVVLVGLTGTERESRRWRRFKEEGSDTRTIIGLCSKMCSNHDIFVLEAVLEAVHEAILESLCTRTRSRARTIMYSYSKPRCNHHVLLLEAVLEVVFEPLRNRTRSRTPTVSRIICTPEQSRMQYCQMGRFCFITLFFFIDYVSVMKRGTSLVR